MRLALKLLAVLVALPGMWLLFEAAKIFLKAYGLRGPDNIGYFVAIYYFIAASLFLGAAFWIYLISMRPK